ncbi:hypothetical protein ACF0H5_007294 [Mactra antiquata]
MSSPIFRRLSHKYANRPFRIVILGQNGVGKSALTVRFLTQRFIGDYDPDLENTYTYTKNVQGENITLEIRDTAAQEENNKLEANIKWADAYVLVYSITDRCSFNECSRLKVLINSFSKRARNNSQSSSSCVPIVLVGNKTDRSRDRMITSAEGREKAQEMNCSDFCEISVMEEADSAQKIFIDLYKRFRRPNGHRRSELQQRVSCPPSLHVPDMKDSEGPTTPLQRRRKALYTIS